MDMIFNSYKMLIVLHQSKKADMNAEFLPKKTVDISRKSIERFQSLVESSPRALWGGTRYVLGNMMSILLFFFLFMRH